MNKTVHYPNLFEIMNIKNDKHQSAGHVPETCWSVSFVLCNVISPTVIILIYYMTYTQFEEVALA